jgi:hypothetical protein
MMTQPRLVALFASQVRTSEATVGPKRTAGPENARSVGLAGVSGMAWTVSVAVDT